MNTSRRFLALGDSYTVGEGVAVNERWPTQLVVSLRKIGIPIDEPIILAQTGWTTGDLLAAIDEANLQGPFDLVTLMIGANNHYQGGDMETYRDEFRALLRRALNFTGSCPDKILGLSIPDWGVTPFNENVDPFQIAAGIDAFNHITKNELMAAGVQYINVTRISRFASCDNTLLTSDNLHPSGKMYASWVELMLPAVLQVLQLPKG